MSEEGHFKNDDVATEQRKDEIHSHAVRAGKRTYFFDVKATRRNDYYLTITESKKRFNRDGKFFYEKHKVFLYKEDFEKFSDALKEMIDYIREANPQPIELEEDRIQVESEEKDFTNVEFEDLDEKKD